MNMNVGNNVFTEICENVKPIDTQKELAKIAGVSHDTIAKVEKIEKSAPEVVERIALYRTTKPIARAESARATNYPTADNVP